MATITAVPESSYGRVRLTISFTAAVTVAKIERQDPGAAWVPIKSGSNYPCVAGVPSPPADDYEAPFDVPVTYRVSQVTPAGAETATVTTTLPSGGRTWLKDPAFSSRNRILYEVTGLPQLSYASRAGVFSIIDRPKPVVVASKRMAWTGALAFSTSTDAERLGIYDLIARGQVLLLATPDGYGIGNAYVHVGDVTEERVGIVTEPTRKWSLPLTVVDRPDALNTASVGVRWVDVKNAYPTWGDLTATGKTWAQVLEGT